MKNRQIEETVNRNIERRKNKWIMHVVRGLVAVILLALAVTALVLFIRVRTADRVSLKKIQKDWNLYDYEAVYDDCRRFLEQNPYNNTALAYYGYACFYLAVSQNDSYSAQNYLDESVNNLRIALYDASRSLRPQLEYMLGKAYFYKNTISTYYYADLAVKYLNLAREDGYQADDISEYLGLSYASLGMTMESISAFTNALLVRESDSLLLSIAEQYYKAGELNASKQYLYRVTKDSDNDDVIIKCRNLLGTIYLEEDDLDSALAEFSAVLEKDDNSADAHYGMGLIYEKQGNVVRARAEWRKALRIQVNHPGALKKMS